MLQRKSKTKRCHHCIKPFDLIWGNEQCSVATMSKKQGVWAFWLQWPVLSRCFGCWAANTRAIKYIKYLYKQCGMKMSQLHESFCWSWQEKRQNNNAAYKEAKFKRKRKRNEKIHAPRFETIKQERQDKKSGLTYSSGVAPTESHETARKFNTIISQCKHCNRNDHRRKSNALFPFFERKLCQSLVWLWHV